MKINRVMILPHEHNSDGTLKIKIKLRASKFQKKSILWTHIQWDAGNCLKTSTQKNKERKHFLKHSSTSLYIIHLCLQNCCKSYINKSIKNITPNHKLQETTDEPKLSTFPNLENENETWRVCGRCGFLGLVCNQCLPDLT